MKVTPLSFVIMMFFVLFLVVFSVFTTEYLSILCANARIDSGISYAAWSGFYHYDLERYASRRDLGEREIRDIYLEDNQVIRTSIKDKIIHNLKLNTDFTPKENSFLEEPFEIVAINIYNPDDLPISILGIEYNVTTIEIITRFMFKVPLADKRTYTKTTVVNADTFLIEGQKE